MEGGRDGRGGGGAAEVGFGLGLATGEGTISGVRLFEGKGGGGTEGQWGNGFVDDCSFNAGTTLPEPGICGVSGVRSFLTGTGGGADALKFGLSFFCSLIGLKGFDSNGFTINGLHDLSVWSS